MNRRHVLTRILQSIAVVAVAPQVFAEQKRGARPAAGGATGDLALPIVDPNSATAKAVKYTHKKSDQKDAAVKTERTGVKWDAQHCHNCSFYTKAGNKEGGEVGKCTIFSGNLVKSEAWCTSWTKKA